jgi:hypothetical protein
MSKNVSKKNETKLKTYLKKVNDVQSNHKTHSNNNAGTPAGKDIRKGTGNRFLN